MFRFPTLSFEVRPDLGRDRHPNTERKRSHTNIFSSRAITKRVSSGSAEWQSPSSKARARTPSAEPIILAPSCDRTPQFPPAPALERRRQLLRPWPQHSQRGPRPPFGAASAIPDTSCPRRSEPALAGILRIHRGRLRERCIAAPTARELMEPILQKASPRADKPHRTRAFLLECRCESNCVDPRRRSDPRKEPIRDR